MPPINRKRPEEVRPDVLAKLKPHEIYNKDKDTTLISTLIGVVFVSVIGTWLTYLCIAYLQYMKDPSAPLPDTSIVKVGIPVFLVAIAVEFIASKIMGLEVYRLNDSMCSLGTGLIQQIVEVLTSLIGNVIGTPLVTGIPYTLIHRDYRIVSLTGIPGFILMFLARDLGYYWFHRIAFMWAVHGVHHRPNEFNYTVSLSQGALQRWTEFFFYAPLALFFPVELYLMLYPIAKLFGFFTHTRLLSGTGPLKYIFITPSLHRIHHASAPSQYIDRNYGEVFSFWDRMFGTYQEEYDPVVYGTVEPHHTWDPLEANFEIWRKLCKKASQCTSITDKFLCFIMPPGWNPETGGEFELPDTTPWSAKKYDSQIPWTLTLYVIFHYLVALLSGIVMLSKYESLPTYYELFMVYTGIIFSLSVLGKLMDRHPLTMRYETMRLALHLVFVWYYQQYLDSTQIALALFSLACSWAVAYSHKDLFVYETEKQWEERTMISCAGRGFDSQVKQSKKSK